MSKGLAWLELTLGFKAKSLSAQITHTEVHRVVKGLLNNLQWVMGLRGKLINPLCIFLINSITYHLSLYICME